MERLDSSVPPKQQETYDGINRWIHPELLWKDRVRSFWSDIMPYLGYVISSGLGILLVFGFVAGMALYASFVEQIPADFPVRELTWLILSPLTAYMTFRTYLVTADIAFMLRIEHRMKAYFRRSIRASLIPRLVLLIAAWGLLWPLYHRAETDPKGFLITLVLLVIVKAVVVCGAWTERHLADKRWRLGMRLLRYVWSFAAVAAWVWLSVPMAGLLIGAAGLLYLWICRLSPKLSFAWEAHIDAERTHVNRIRTFLSGFVDLPAGEERRFARPWLNRIGDRFAWKHGQAYEYLLTKTLVRSELMGILIRLTVIGFILLWWVKSSQWSVLLLLLFVIAVGAQCAALFQMHRHDVWRSLYPLQPGAKQRAARSLGTRLHLISSVLMFIPIVFGSTSIEFKMLAALGAMLVLLGFWLHRGSKKYAEDQDEE